MPEAPQLASFDTEKQRLYSELLNNEAPHPIAKGDPRNPSEEAHFHRLHPQSQSQSHHPQLVAIEEGRRVNALVQLCRPVGYLQHCRCCTNLSVKLSLKINGRKLIVTEKRGDLKEQLIYCTQITCNYYCYREVLKTEMWP